MKYRTYITTKHLKGEGICGTVSIPYGTKLNAEDGFIICPSGPVCAVTSQNAYDHFSQDDDGQGLERGKLVKDILRRLKRLKPSAQRYDHVWGKIWADERLQKYRRTEHADHWLWNYDFYNATIEDLTYTRNLVMRG